MTWLHYSLLLTLLWAANCQNTGVESNKSEESTFLEDPKDNDIFLHPIVAEPTLSDFTGEAENRTQVSAPENATKSTEVNFKSDKVREVKNATFADIKPFLFFPILPYLFPPRVEEENPGSLALGKNDTSKNEGSPAPDVKPFIFFDFAFNIRRIPISNITDGANDSKIINVKKLSIRNSDDPGPDSLKNRRRRNTKMETPGFFDDAPLFPDSELDEFLPKPDLFFPDLPFHRKPAKKLSRRKRDQKKMELKNDLKSFFDAFDEAFMRTKRELEWADPILNFLRGGEPTQFEEEKKDADELFGQLPDIQEKPSVKWRIQRNIKRLNNDRGGGLAKANDSPTIIVDKVVKIGEFHVHDDGREKNKKKRGLIESKRKFLGHESLDEITSNSDDQNVPRSTFELIKQEGSKRKKRVHPKSPEEGTPKKTESRDTRKEAQMTASVYAARGKKTEETSKKEAESNVSKNGTEKILNLMKIFDSIKDKMQSELKHMVNTEKFLGTNGDREGTSYFRENLKRNLTELLKEFLELNKQGADAGEKRLDRHKHFDWTEKEALLNSAVKTSRQRRQKEEAAGERSSVGDDHQKQKQYVDLNFLFFNVTIPTILVFGVVLVICFFSLQVKGKLCRSLFRSRQVLILNEETVSLKNPGAKKLQAI